MKLLIIAGPYEADRIRRAAVSAHFETVAVEPGESLSGWISASRPDAIVMAPRMVNPDPAVALAKIRSVPRGRVPIFLVGDADDEERLRGLADGFFVRPIAPEDLVEQARARLARDDGDGDVKIAAGEGGGSGPVAAAPPAGGAAAADGHEGAGPVSGAGPAPASGSAPGLELPSLASQPAPSARTPKSGPHAAKALGGLKPLVAAGAEPAAAPPVLPPLRARSDSAADLLSRMAVSIDESLEAEIQDVVRELAGPPLEAEPPAEPLPEGELDDADQALAELRDESSQKTVEVPTEAFARMMQGGGGAEGRKGEPSPRRPRAAATATARIEIVPAPVETGPIGSPDIAALLGRIFLEALSGSLTFRRGDVEKTISFVHGAPIAARSSLPDDRMGAMLVREGHLLPEQWRAGGETASASGRGLGGVLVEMGLLKPAELAPLVRRHFEDIIWSMFAWAPAVDGPGSADGSGSADAGEWALGPDTAEAAEEIGIVEPPAALILEGIRRKHTAPRLLDCLGGERQVLRLRDGIGTTRLLERMALTEAEQSVVALFDGVRPLGEVRAAANLPEATVYGVAWALSVLGRLQRVDAADEVAVDAEAAARDRARDRALDRARVLARYQLVREGDYFQLLGLPRDASPHEVLRAHQALGRELGANALDPEVVAELGDELRAIHTVVDEGVRVLADARMRQRYLSSLGAPPPPIAPPAPAAARRPE